MAKATVLLVDDDEVLRQTLAAVLRAIWASKAKMICAVFTVVKIRLDSITIL